MMGVVVAALAGMRLGPNLTPLPIPQSRGRTHHRWLLSTCSASDLHRGAPGGAGVVVFQASLAHIIGFVLLWLVLTVKALGEERMLSEKHEGYTEYVARTGRFFPRLTRS